MYTVVSWKWGYNALRHDSVFPSGIESVNSISGQSNNKTTMTKANQQSGWTQGAANPQMKLAGLIVCTKINIYQRWPLLGDNMFSAFSDDYSKWI